MKSFAYDARLPKSSARRVDVEKALIEVLIQEAQAITYLADNFPSCACDIVDMICKTKGHVVFSGNGKSGLIARKLVATFSSVGIPSLFLHPSDALHGDLGMVGANDLCIILSKSATGKELELFIYALRSQGNDVILICCQKGGLFSHVKTVVLLPFKQEACLFNLAPTSSSTLMLAFGDALAIVASKLQGFDKQAFAKLHPCGALGKSLLFTVEALMHRGTEVPILPSDASFQDTLLVITGKKLGVAVVVDHQNRLAGVITDGDLRRACYAGKDVFDKRAGDIMTTAPKTIFSKRLAYEALHTMEDFSITSLIVVDDKKNIEGLIHIHDLVKAGIKQY